MLNLSEENLKALEVYLIDDGIEGFDEGPVPDRYLRRLTPPQN
jgi:hypothetical protein